MDINIETYFKELFIEWTKYRKIFIGNNETDIRYRWFISIDGVEYNIEYIWRKEKSEKRGGNRRRREDKI